MNSSEKDYTKLYRLQDKFLEWGTSYCSPFYLTGGTALGRFYLNHRYSEDLDFFINADKNYSTYITELKNNINTRFKLDFKQSVFYDDFSRLFIYEDDTVLKIEIVNDVSYYAGSLVKYKYGKIDTPLNILSNKLTAIIGRDDPKDIFDIIHIALNYSFDWTDIFYHAKQKAIINEIDIEQRLVSFPVEWFNNIHWLAKPVNLDSMKRIKERIAEDFFLGKPNSFGLNNIPIEQAKPFK